MATRRPLVLASGRTTELPYGDVLDSITIGGTLNLSQSTWHKIGNANWNYADGSDLYQQIPSTSGTYYLRNSLGTTQFLVDFNTGATAFYGSVPSEPSPRTVFIGGGLFRSKNNGASFVSQCATSSSYNYIGVFDESAAGGTVVIVHGSDSVGTMGEYGESQIYGNGTPLSIGTSADHKLYFYTNGIKAAEIDASGVSTLYGIDLGSVDAGSVRIGGGILRADGLGWFGGNGYFGQRIGNANATLLELNNYENYSTFIIYCCGSTGYSIPSWVNNTVIESAKTSGGSVVVSSYYGDIVFQTAARTTQAKIGADGAATFYGDLKTSGKIYAGLSGSGWTLEGYNGFTIPTATGFITVYINGQKYQIPANKF